MNLPYIIEGELYLSALELEKALSEKGTIDIVTSTDILCIINYTRRIRHRTKVFEYIFSFEDYKENINNSINLYGISKEISEFILRARTVRLISKEHKDIINDYVKKNYSHFLKD